MFSLALTALVLSLSLTAASHALLNKRDSRSALAWVSLCLVMPLFGPIAYLLFGINRARSTATKLYSDKEATASQLAEAIGHGDDRTLIGARASGRKLLPCSDIKFLRNGEELFPAMLAEIERAEQSVYLCSYLFQADAVGRQFVTALSAAQARGVEVAVLIDGLGELAYPPRVARLLRKTAVPFKLFDPIRLLPPSLHINLRNHRKNLIIDGRIAFTGGHNISARHLVEAPSNAAPARDLHTRLEGPIVKEFTQAFLHDWERSAGAALQRAASDEQTQPQTTCALARLILDGPNEELDKLNDVLLGVFSSAKVRLWLMTPYFLPEADLIGALTAARLRGVDVRVILPLRGNVHLAHWAAQHTLRRLVQNGLAVYLLPPPFVHSKAVLIDDDYALIGSANLDPRSLRLNFELGLEIFSESCNRWLRDYFEHMLDTAEPLDAEAEDHRTRLARYRDAIAWLFSPYL